MAYSPPSMPPVNGSTDVYLIVGDPVEQVQAPAVFNQVFATMGINAILVPVHVTPENLAHFVRTAFAAKNIKGMWAAIPHKAPLVSLLDHCSPLGRLAGAVNGIRRNADGSIEGGLFDGEGLVCALDHYGMAFSGKRVLILGAGGGASAIAASLACAAQGAPLQLHLYDPASAKAQAVAQRIAQSSSCDVQAVSDNDPAGYDLVVHASPLGLHTDDPLPCDPNRLQPGSALFDIVMKNQPTPLVRAARARGLNAQPGFEMLIHQTPLYLEFFGFHTAAAQVRHDARFLRELIYPQSLQTEIHTKETLA